MEVDAAMADGKDEKKGSDESMNGVEIVVRLTIWGRRGREVWYR